MNWHIIYQEYPNELIFVSHEPIPVVVVILKQQLLLLLLHIFTPELHCLTTSVSEQLNH